MFVKIEDAVLLSDFGKNLKPSRTWKTIYWWCKYGRINRFTREKVKLDYINLPAGMATSAAAYLRFITKLNEC